MSNATATKPTLQNLKDVNITPTSLKLFMDYAKDAGNWGGAPLIGGNVGGGKEERGNVTQLKKAGLINTNVSDGCTWLHFTTLGIAFALVHGVHKDGVGMVSDCSDASSLADAQALFAEYQRSVAPVASQHVTDAMKFEILAAVSKKLEVLTVNKETNRLETAQFQFGRVEGTYRFESQKISLAGENGFWASAFSVVSAEVCIAESVQASGHGVRYIGVAVVLSWGMATGGCNGTRLDLFWLPGKAQLVNRDELRHWIN